MTFTDHFVYSVLRCLSGVLTRLSPASRPRLAQNLASFIFHFVPLRKQHAIREINNAIPELTPLHRQHLFRSMYIHFVGEFFNFLMLPISYHHADFSVEGKDILDDYYQQGKGLILITGHFGAWEMLVSWLGHSGYKIVAVANRQSNRGADKYFRERRETGKMKHIYNKRGSKAIKGVLKDQRILILVSDQDARKKGVFVNFFGRPASTARGAAVYHQRTQAPILFSTCVTDGPNRYRIRFQIIPENPRDSITQITQNFTSLLEQAIREHPEQYFWFHRRWKTKPPTSAKGTHA